MIDIKNYKNELLTAQDFIKFADFLKVNEYEDYAIEFSIPCHEICNVPFSIAEETLIKNGSFDRTHSDQLISIEFKLEEN